jgi:hypothetical protein
VAAWSQSRNRADTPWIAVGPVLSVAARRFPCRDFLLSASIDRWVLAVETLPD